MLYEFCKLLKGEDAKATIVSSWQKTCDKLKSQLSVSSEEESEFERDMLVFKIIERNIYNKNPSIHPVFFIKVIVLHRLLTNPLVRVKCVCVNFIVHVYTSSMYRLEKISNLISPVKINDGAKAAGVS